MQPQELVDQVAQEIGELVKLTGFSHVSCIELIIGACWEVDPDAVEELFEDFFASHADEKLRGTCAEITIVSPGDVFPAPGRSDIQTANGFEILITNLRGRK